MSGKTPEVTHDQSRFITAPLAEVWRLHIDAEAWPTWNSDVIAVTMDGPMAARSTFTTTTTDGGWHVRVYALTAEELTFWGDVMGDGSHWLQTWIFQETIRGVHVTATTSVIGSNAAARAALAASLRVAADGRLDYLQLCAELLAARRT